VAPPNELNYANLAYSFFTHLLKKDPNRPPTIRSSYTNFQMYAFCISEKSLEEKSYARAIDLAVVKKIAIRVLRIASVCKYCSPTLSDSLRLTFLDGFS